jgi:heme-degrading monooxygenase HmoA
MLWYRAKGAGEEELTRAYHAVGASVSGAPGLLGNELFRSAMSPDSFAVSSEWRSLADFRAWADDPAHREHTSQLDEFRDEDRPGGRYEVYEVLASYEY